MPRSRMAAPRVVLPSMAFVNEILAPEFVVNLEEIGPCGTPPPELFGQFGGSENIKNASAIHDKAGARHANTWGAYIARGNLEIAGQSDKPASNTIASHFQTFCWRVQE